jgi:hypothetical protein
MDPREALRVGREFLDAFRRPSNQEPAVRGLVEPEEGWSNCCAVKGCWAPIDHVETQYKGEPWPEGLKEAVERGEALVANTEPLAIGKLTCVCEIGHRFTVRETQRDHARNFQREWRGLVEHEQRF